MNPHLDRFKSPSRHAGLDPASRFSLDSGFRRNDKIGNVGVGLLRLSGSKVQRSAFIVKYEDPVKGGDECNGFL